MRYKLIVSVALVVLGLGVSVASAARLAPGWSVDTLAAPSNFSADDNAACLAGLAQEAPSPEACDAYYVTVRNAGSAAGDGSPVVVADSLPVGLTVQRVRFFWSGLPAEEGGPTQNLTPFGLCSTSPVRCELPTKEFGWPPVAPDDTLRMIVYVTVTGASGALTNSATVSGGGAPEAATGVQNTAGGAPSVFGMESFDALIAGVDGMPDTQAGGHPQGFATTVDLNNELRLGPKGVEADTSVEDVRDVVVDLPLGFLGSALAAPECTLAQLSSEKRCPADTTVGHIDTQPEDFETALHASLYNVVPERGVAAEFGYHDEIRGSHVLYSSVVPTTTGYVLRTIAQDIPQVALTRIEVKLYGNPSEKDGTGNSPVAFFTNPASCSGEPLKTTIHMDSWQSPGAPMRTAHPTSATPAG